MTENKRPDKSQNSPLFYVTIYTNSFEQNLANIREKIIHEGLFHRKTIFTFHKIQNIVKHDNLTNQRPN